MDNKRKIKEKLKRCDNTKKTTSEYLIDTKYSIYQDRVMNILQRVYDK